VAVNSHHGDPWVNSLLQEMVLASKSTPATSGATALIATSGANRTLDRANSAGVCK
jgi:hypothetical protein